MEPVIEGDEHADQVNRTFRSQNPEHQITFEWMSFDQMIIDSRIQRPANMAEQRKIAARLNPAALGTITLSKRVGEGGLVTYVVLDGQQRRGGAMLAGYDEKVRCLVHHNLPLTEEAQLFLDLNFRYSVPATTTFKVQLVAENPSALALQAVLDGLGIPACLPSGFQAVQTGRRLVERVNGVVNLTWALEQVKAIYDEGQGEVYNGLAVEAFFRLFERHGNMIDVSRLRKNLGSFPNGVLGLGAAATTVKQTSVRGRSSDHWAQAIINRYNKGLPRNSKHALPNWDRRNSSSADIDRGEERPEE
jgi:hypothetical protein